MKTVDLDVHKDTVFCGIPNGESCSEVKEYTTLTCDIRSMGRATAFKKKCIFEV